VSHRRADGGSCRCAECHWSRFHKYEAEEPAWLLPDGGPRVRVVVIEMTGSRTSRGDVWRVRLPTGDETHIFGDQLEPMSAVERLAELARGA